MYLHKCCKETNDIILFDGISSFDYHLWQPFAHLEFSLIAELQAVTRQFIRIFESSPLNVNGFTLNLILLLSFVGINCKESSTAQLRKKKPVNFENGFSDLLIENLNYQELFYKLASMNVLSNP